MAPENPVESNRFLRGASGLVITIALVGILVLALPAYRWFFLISLAVGIVVAGGLFLFHRLKPIKEEDVHNKRPLGLS
jgi:hypothetical protein